MHGGLGPAMLAAVRHRPPVPGRRLPARRPRRRRPVVELDRDVVVDRARRHRRRRPGPRSSAPSTTCSSSRSTATACAAVVNVQPDVVEVAYHGQRFVFDRPRPARRPRRRVGDGTSPRRCPAPCSTVGVAEGDAGRGGRGARRDGGDEDGAVAQGAVRRHRRRRSARPPATRWRSGRRCSWSRRRPTMTEPADDRAAPTACPSA